MRLRVILLCTTLFLPPAFGDVYMEEGTEAVVGDAEETAKDESNSFDTRSRTDSQANKRYRKNNIFENRWFDVTGNLAFVSNYLYRGFTETFGGPAVQAGLNVSQKDEQGFFAGMWGSNVDGTTAANGSGIELIFSGGYNYKFNRDFSARLEIRNTRYPGAYNPTDTKDSYDMWEVIPGFTYKYFTFIWAYQTSNVSGINQNFVQEFYTPIPPNGNTKGSWYAEGSVNYPIPGTNEKLKLQALVGYWHIKNYSMLTYTVIGGGVSYQIPEEFGGLIFSLNGTATNAKKKYYTNINLSEQSKFIGAPTIWAGVMKRF